MVMNVSIDAHTFLVMGHGACMFHPFPAGRRLRASTRARDCAPAEMMLDVALLSVEAWKLQALSAVSSPSVDDDCGASCCKRMCVSMCMHAWPSVHSDCHARRSRT